MVPEVIPPKHAGGRPHKHIDLEMVRKLAVIGCTHEEIAYALDVSVDTLARSRSFAEAYKRGDAGGKQSLRHKQFQLALEGNVSMLVWLGKNRLYQKDVVTTEHTGEVTINDGARERLISRMGSFLPAPSPREGDSLAN